MIKYGKVELLSLEKNDLKQTVEWLNTPEVSYPLGKAFPFNLTDTERWYDENVPSKKAVIFKILVGVKYCNTSSSIGNITKKHTKYFQ